MSADPVAGTAPAGAPSSATSTAPPGAVARSVVRERARALALWSVAVGAVAAMYTAFWPSIGGGDVVDAYLGSMPPALVDAMGLDAMSSPGGYLSATVYALLGAALLLVLTVGSGARLVAGAEEDGTLELELAAPVSRRRVYLERLVALWVSALVVVAALTVAVLVAATAVGMDVGTGRVLAGSAGLLALAVAVGTVALAAGAVTGRRAVALGVGAGVAVASYLAHALGATVDGAGWLQQVSPWGWYLGGDPLTTGLDVGGLALLAALTAVATVVGLVVFERRDLMV